MITTPLRVLVDTNVVLDLLLAREPWLRDAGNLLTALQRGDGVGLIAGHSVTTVHYVMAKAYGRDIGREAVRYLLQSFEIVPVGAALFQRALALGLPDFEDAVQLAAAEQGGAAWIATRNVKDFGDSPIPALPPAEVLILLSETSS